MKTATAQSHPNLAFIKYWGNGEMFTSPWQPTIKTLWTRKHTFRNRALEAKRKINAECLELDCVLTLAIEYIHPQG
jgi:hypothetical protein